MNGSAQDDKAVVVDSDGFQSNGQPAKRGQTVDKGTKFSGKRAAEVLLSCNDVVAWYVCKQETCEVTACADKSPGVQKRDLKFDERAPRPSGIIDRLLALGKRDPTPAAVAGARGMGSLVDAVVLLDDRGVHWAPAFAGVYERNYCLVVSTLPASRQTWTTTLQWDPRRDAEGLAPVPGLTTGLYAVGKGSPGAGCVPDPNEEPGWVLIVGPATFSQLDPDWRSQAASIDELEQSGASPRLVATLRHAVLSGLADR
jgi:hypothetical protein